MAAIQNDVFGKALKFASPRLKQDKDVVMTAIKQTCGKAFEHASPSLRRDKEFVMNRITKENSPI